MSTRNDGGPAFPQLDAYVDSNGERPVYASHDGMTMRDYFAAKATEQDISAHIDKGGSERYTVRDPRTGRVEVMLRDAKWTREQAKYRYADAMLKAREE